MTTLAIGLVLLAAVLHATWNLLAKRVQGNASFIWFYDVLTLGIFAPFVFLFVLFSHTSFTVWTCLFILVSGLLELAYFLLLAAYTLWDKEALSIGHLAPLVLYYGTVCIRIPVLTPFALRHWQEVRVHWHIHRMEGLGIGVLSALSYILVLTALAFTPVSFIAPFREVSVLFGILLGTYVLAEEESKRRLLAASIIVVGIIALAL